MRVTRVLPLVGLLLLRGSVASAQAAGGASAIAESLFQQARELVKQGRYDEACPKLAESQRLDPKIGTLLNLAVCHAKQGKTASAWAEYTSAAEIARRDGQREREDFARKEVASLEKQLARVTLKVTAPDPGLQITLDDQPMSAATYGVPLPVDPGTHRIAATAAGKAAWSRQLDVPPHQTEIVVTIPTLEPAAAAPPPPPVIVPPLPPPTVPPPVSAPPAAPPAAGPSNTPAILMGVGFGVGGAGLLVGAITGGISAANTSSIRSTCNPNNVCPSRQQGAINSATALANVANAGLAFGAAGLVVGIVGVVLRPKARETGWRVTPIVGPGTAGLRGSF